MKGNNYHPIISKNGGIKMIYSYCGFCLGIFLVAVAACGGEMSFDETEREPAVYGGQDAKQNQFEAVGKLIYNNQMKCTVFLIRPRVVATASHCLESSFAVFAMDPTDFSVYFASLNKTYRVVDLDRPLFRDLSRNNQFADVAVLLLEKEVPVTPIGISRSTQPVGTKTTVVGYGRSPTGSTGTLRYGETAISSPPLKSGLTTGLIEAGPAAAGSCFGDSGGPWLVGGKAVGVTHGYHYGTPICKPNTSIELATAMSIWGLWVDKAANRMQGKADKEAKNEDQFRWYNDANATELFSESPVQVDNLITEVPLAGDFNGDGCDDELTWRRTALSKPDEVSVVHGCGNGQKKFKVPKGLRMLHLIDADGQGGDDVMLQLSNRIVVLVPKSGSQYEWTGLPASYRPAFADVDGKPGREILLVNSSRIDMLSWHTKKHTTNYVSIPTNFSGINGTYDVDGKPGKELVLTVVGGLRIISFQNGFTARTVTFPGTSWVINAHEDLDGDGDEEIVVAQPGVVRIVDATTVTPFTMPNTHYIIYGVGQTDKVAGDEVVLRSMAGIRILSYKQRKLKKAKKLPKFKSSKSGIGGSPCLTSKQKPKLRSPRRDDRPTTSPTYSFKPSPNTDRYLLRVKQLFNKTETKRWYDASAICSSSKCSISHSGPQLKAHLAYEWAVRPQQAVCFTRQGKRKTNKNGPWSKTAEFTPY